MENEENNLFRVFSPGNRKIAFYLFYKLSYLYIFSCEFNKKPYRSMREGAILLF